MPAPCLHCAIARAIEPHHEKHVERTPAGAIIMDVEDVLCRLAEAATEIVAMADDRARRRKLMRFLHDAVDSAMKARRVGHSVEVASGTEH